ncbi:MAG: hypothetical protein HUU60_02470 [Armatimonadetes bacterium]|nr:hypothetical protein [Armatimonadota bacterium]
MRNALLWLVCLLIIGGAEAQGLKGLANKSEGKKSESSNSPSKSSPGQDKKPDLNNKSSAGSNKPAPSNPSPPAQGRSEPRSQELNNKSSAGANRPVQADAPRTPASPTNPNGKFERDTTIRTGDLFRKGSDQRTQPIDPVDRSFNRPGSPADDQYYRLRDRSNDPMYYPSELSTRFDNRPVPSGGNLRGLVTRAEHIDRNRWEPHRDYWRSKNWDYGYYCWEPVVQRVCYTPYWYYITTPAFIPYWRVVIFDRPLYVILETPFVISSGYYLERPARQESVYEIMVGDVRRAWTLRDPDYLERYVRPNSYVSIFLDGQYAYSLPAEDYLNMTQDALRSVRTSRLTFEKTFKRGNDQFVMYGTHDYVDEQGNTRRVYVMYAFQQDGRSWYLIDAGSSDRPWK